MNNSIATDIATNDDMIIIRQLPIIEESMRAVSVQIDERLAVVNALVCSEDTVKQVKTVRAEFNKEFAAFEERRKAVQSAIMTPYDEFKATYDECIGDKYKNADAVLKAKIAEVEAELKSAKSSEVVSYFEEYLLSKNIDFIDFKRTGIIITLSASMKSLKAAAKDFIDRVCDDLALIDTQENKDEILVEYKRSLNVSQAITTVSERLRAIEAQKARAAEIEERRQVETAAVSRVDEALNAPLAPPIEQPATTKEPVITVRFTISDTRARLLTLRKFMDDGGYTY